MARIPKFDEETARRLFETYPGSKQEKAAALVKFYGIESDVRLNPEEGAYRSHDDIVPFIGSIVKEKQRTFFPEIFVDSYKGIEFEPRASRKKNSDEKELLHFNDSLDRIKSAGYERHGRPSEVFSLIIDGLEGKLANTPLQNVYDDIFKSYGEFLSLAWERKGDLLIAYLDPEDLVWNSDKYVKKGFKFAEKQEFDITGKNSQQWIDLNEFDVGFVEWHYARKFSELPKEMQKGSKRVQVYLPSEGNIWAVGRGSYSYRFNINCYYVSRASRGARKKIP